MAWYPLTKDWKYIIGGISIICHSLKNYFQGKPVSSSMSTIFLMILFVLFKASLYQSVSSFRILLPSPKFKIRNKMPLFKTAWFSFKKKICSTTGMYVSDFWFTLLCNQTINFPAILGDFTSQPFPREFLIHTHSSEVLFKLCPLDPSSKVMLEDKLRSVTKSLGTMPYLMGL